MSEQKATRAVRTGPICNYILNRLLGSSDVYQILRSGKEGHTEAGRKDSSIGTFELESRSRSAIQGFGRRTDASQSELAVIEEVNLLSVSSLYCMNVGYLTMQALCCN